MTTNLTASTSQLTPTRRTAMVALLAILLLLTTVVIPPSAEASNRVAHTDVRCETLSRSVRIGTTMYGDYHGQYGATRYRILTYNGSQWQHSWTSNWAVGPTAGPRGNGDVIVVSLTGGLARTHYLDFTSRGGALLIAAEHSWWNGSSWSAVTRGNVRYTQSTGAFNTPNVTYCQT